MKKVLRSLIQEKFPLELRVQLDLLSRRRDLINKEKQDEIFKILRDFNVEGVVPLGPGTNRYAFRLDGFVVKVATDNDGKIDNLKEFKMSPILQPYVTKTYEVSENGVLLVAEYIQPFQTYTEMLQYQNQIRDILGKLSSVYLLGDVGVTSKNATNWGVRIGTEEPVCLDFAYVFDTSSDIFVCQACKTNSMLVPTKDFTALVCQNPACGKRYSFEEIRMRISNEVHMKEIGDLTELGYVMEESNVNTELIPSKSKYLEVNKPAKVKKKVVEEQPVELDNFIYEEENVMSDDMVAKYAENGLIVNARVVQATVIPEPDDEPVFTATIEEPGVVSGYVQDDVVIQNPDDDMSIPEIQAVETSEEAEEEDCEEEEDDTDVVMMNTNDEFSDEFLHNLSKAISKVSNKIGDDLYQRGVFDKIGSYIKKKREFPEPFYTAVQNAVFRSLIRFCGMRECNMPNDKNPGYHRDWELADEIPVEAVNTLHFIERFWHIRPINRMDNGVEIMERYHSQFSDYPGISTEWKRFFVARLIKKYPITQDGAERVAHEIAKVWCDDEPDDDGYGYDEENDPTEDNDGDLAFTGEIEEDVEDVEEEAEETDDDTQKIRVTIDNDHNMIYIHTFDSAGEVYIPIYTTQDQYHYQPNNYVMGSELNGDYEWLIHFMPDMMFKTSNPKRWLDRYNNDDYDLRAVVMDDTDEKNVIMGLYYYGGFWIQWNGELTYTDDPTIIKDVNKIICSEIGTTHISYLQRALADEGNIHDESFMYDLEKEAEENVSDDEDQDYGYDEEADPTDENGQDQFTDDDDAGAWVKSVLDGNEEAPEPTEEEERAEDAEVAKEELEQEDFGELTEGEKAVLDALGFNDSDEDASVTFKPIRRQDVESK